LSFPLGEIQASPILKQGQGRGLTALAWSKCPGFTVCVVFIMRGTPFQACMEDRWEVHVHMKDYYLGQRWVISGMERSPHLKSKIIS
jgi:hypothetical protein